MSAGAQGTTPPGVQGEREASRWVRGMFDRVARRYDLLNHLLSFNMDRRWRATAVRRLRPVLHRPGARVMDICCGTADLLIALEREAGRGLSGSDFSHPMLVEARAKLASARLASEVVEADALALPLPDASLDLITAAFGFRNLANYQRGLEEMRRVLRPGGMAAILEFSQPPSALFGSLYSVYSNRVLPAIGGLVSGERSAYRYLPESVRRFPPAPELAERMRQAGFAEVSFERLTGGVVALHRGTAR